MNILQKKTEIAFDFPTYHERILKWLAEGKTSGTNHSEDYLEYTKMNMHRMERLLKTVKLNADLQAAIKAVQRPLLFLTISEAWCGDAAQNIPPIFKMTEHNDAIQMRLVWRDENMDLMNKYLTNGGMSIPKVIVVDAETFEELAVWGPRPKPAQQMVLDYKKDDRGLSYQDFVKEVQLWYTKDKTQSLQAEWLAIFESLASK